MPIVINIDVMLARRKMSSGELAEKVGITPANLSILKCGKAKAIRITGHLPRPRLPAGRHSGVQAGRVPVRISRPNEAKAPQKRCVAFLFARNCVNLPIQSF